MSYYKPIGNPAELQKKMAENPKFSRVTTTLDTGVSTTVMKRLHEFDVNLKQAPGENFKRMHPNSLARYIDFVQMMAQQQQQPGATADRMADIYEGDVFAGVMPALEAQNQPQKKILLLDIRDPEDYLKCHLATAQSFHFTRLNRSQNVWTPEIIKAINKDDWVILIYDLQEETATRMNVANGFFEKGINNVMVLAGGLREFAQRHSSLLVGECPVPIMQRPTLPERATVMSTCTRSKAGSVAGGSVADGASAVSRASMATSSRPRPLASSLARRSSSAVKGWH